MQQPNVPSTGPRYWAALSIASVFGANLGDFVSRELHLGHVRGLLPLALVFAAILLTERRVKAASQAYYWLAIVTLRMAATNLGDLATHDLKLGYAWVIAGLAVLLLAVLASGRPAQVAGGMPPTNARYWIGMLIAGTLGTAVGDALAGEVGLVAASAVLGGAVAVLFVVRTRTATKASYWSTIVAIRSAGTTLGDLVAHGLGLVPSTAVTGLLLAGLLFAWPAPAGGLIRRPSGA